MIIQSLKSYDFDFDLEIHDSLEAELMMIIKLQT